jgi:hypothetical protein
LKPSSVEYLLNPATWNSGVFPSQAACVEAPSLSVLQACITQRPGKSHQSNIRATAFASFLHADMRKQPLRKAFAIARNLLPQKTQLRNKQVFVGGAHAMEANFISPIAADIPKLWTISENAEQEINSPLARTLLRFLAILTIHPLVDANGRCARALLVNELWRFVPAQVLYATLAKFFGNESRAGMMAINAAQLSAHPKPFIDQFLNAFEIARQEHT